MISDPPSTSSAANVNGSSHTKGFDAQSFLHLLRHKTLAIIGDDVALEMFLALDADLQPLASPDSSRLRPTRGNAVTASKNETAHLQGQVGGKEAICYFTSRSYPKFNATVTLCNCVGSRVAAPLNAMTSRSANTAAHTILSQCIGRRDGLRGSNKSSTSQVGVLSHPQDFVVIAFGPSYRPLFTADRHSYTVRLNDSVNAFKVDMAGLRRQIRLHNKARHGRSHSNVIWSLLPHMGVLETETEIYETMSGQKNDTVKGTSIGEKLWMKFL
jgi:hypothetical protein